MSESNERMELIVAYAGNFVDVGFAKTLLDARHSMLCAESEDGHTMPWAVSPAGIGSVQLVIRAEDADRVRPIIEDLIKGENDENAEQ